MVYVAPNSPNPTADSLDVLGALAEPNRRRLYDYVVANGGWVSRDQAADGVELQRSVAAHHLDRLAGDGLLDVDYQRRSGRSGPGAGRPAKVYRRSQRDFEVALPPRDYELIGRLLADAIETSTQTGTDITAALDETARRQGRRLGHAMQVRLGRSRSKRRTRETVVAVLSSHGFEPVEVDDHTIVLRNCPFHHLAKSHTDLVCGINHCMISAAIAELGIDGLDTRLEPDPDTCCVRLHQR